MILINIGYAVYDYFLTTGHIYMVSLHLATIGEVFRSAWAPALEIWTVLYEFLGIFFFLIYSLAVIFICNGIIFSNVYLMNLLFSYLISVIRYLLTCNLAQHGLCKYFVVREIYPKVFAA